MFCPACGTKAKENDAFCIQCGARLPARPAQSAPPLAGPLSATPRPAARKSSNTTLVVVLVAIGGLMLLGIVSAVAIPSLLAARDKTRVKSTRQDLNTISIALQDYLTDNGALPVQDGSIGSGSELFAKLSPFYVKVLPAQDGWGRAIQVYCGEACNGRYGLSGCQADDFLVVSLGKDGITEDWQFSREYSSGSPGPAPAPIGSREQGFNRDLVIFNGSWVRAPDF